MHYYSSDKCERRNFNLDVVGHDFIHNMRRLRQKDHEFMASLLYIRMNKWIVGFYFTKSKLLIFFSEYFSNTRYLLFWKRYFYVIQGENIQSIHVCFICSPDDVFIFPVKEYDARPVCLVLSTNTEHGSLSSYPFDSVGIVFSERQHAV